MGRVMAFAQQLSELSATDIAAALRLLNDRQHLASGHGLYMGLLRFGDGDRQAGAELMAAWMGRNLAMCARLVQHLCPGDRAFLLVGSSHVKPTRDCLRVIPGSDVVDGIDYLQGSSDPSRTSRGPGMDRRESSTAPDSPRESSDSLRCSLVRTARMAWFRPCQGRPQTPSTSSVPVLITLICDRIGHYASSPGRRGEP